VVRYQPSVLIIERDAQQKHFIGDERLERMQREYGFQVVPHTTSRNKADPILGVASMAGAFLRNEIVIPWGDEFTRDRMGTLIAQLRAWRANVPTRLLIQDGVMSLWFNWRNWMENRIERGVNDLHSEWHQNALPYEPTPYRVASFG
jgi:hypothetical protein